MAPEICGHALEGEPMGEIHTAAKCAVLAIAHGGLSEGIRNLLGSAFNSVVTVADEGALIACVESLHPEVVVFDLALAPGTRTGIFTRLRALRPGLRLIALGADDDPGRARAAKIDGADRYLLKRTLGTELPQAVDELLAESDGNDPRDEQERH